MAIQTIDVQIQNITVDKLLTLINAKEEILIRANDVPLGHLVPTSESSSQHIAEKSLGNSNKRILGLHSSVFWMSDDFDVPLSDEFWLGNDA